jgi:hypothetical protein
VRDEVAPLSTNISGIRTKAPSETLSGNRPQSRHNVNPSQGAAVRGPLRRQECALISNAFLSAAYRALTSERSKPALSGNEPDGRINFMILLAIFGAGEGIRTLDPNLGKVVLYP